MTMKGSSSNSDVQTLYQAKDAITWILSTQDTTTFIQKHSQCC